MAMGGGAVMFSLFSITWSALERRLLDERDCELMSINFVGNVYDSFGAWLLHYQPGLESSEDIVAAQTMITPCCYILWCFTHTFFAIFRENSLYYKQNITCILLAIWTQMTWNWKQNLRLQLNHSSIHKMVIGKPSLTLTEFDNGLR